jgi:cobalt-zinc-cadmium efflux system membrane fusion protein
MNKKQTFSIALILGAGALLAWLILGTNRPQPAAEEGHGHAEAVDSEHQDADAVRQKGPHGGRLFIQNGYGIEVTIFEQGVAPQFRLYAYRDGKPLAPEANRAVLTLERLGRPPQVFKFVAEQDYLKGDAVVEEPHSFQVTVDARSGQAANRFSYEQVEARVAMSDAQAQQNGVEILTAGPVHIKSHLQLLGEIKFNEDKLVHLVPRLAGVAASVSANTGDRVRKGQVLAVISSQALADQRAELLAAQKRLALARTTHEREKQLWEEKISAEQDYLQARGAMQEAEIAVQGAQQKLASLGGQRAGGDLTRYELRSPIDGIVVEKHLALGEAVREDATVFVVADLSTVWAEMTVYAKDLGTVKIGQQATVAAAAFHASSSGMVSYVGALVGAQTRTATARVVLPNPAGEWRPGLPVNIELIAGEVAVPVAVAAEAIQTVRDWNVVFGRYGEYFEARPIELGRSDGKWVEVVGGLNAGERYAAKNSYLLKADLGKSAASHDH